MNVKNAALMRLREGGMRMVNGDFNEAKSYRNDVQCSCLLYRFTPDINYQILSRQSVH